MPKDSEEFIPTRSSLLSRLKDWDDQESWGAFFDTYSKLIYGCALRAGLTTAEAEDVLQETVLSVAKEMKDFKYNPALGSFKGWLLQLVRWRILNQLKKRIRAQSLSLTEGDSLDETPVETRVPDPTTLVQDDYWDQEWQRNLLNAAVERIKPRVNPRQFRIFYLHVFKERPAREVARTFNLNVAQVYLAKSRIAALINKEIRLLEKRMI